MSTGIAAKVFDALTGGIGAKIFGTIDKLVPDRDLNQQLKHSLDMAELTAGVDLKKVEVEAERDVTIAIETTHQAALNQSDLVTKRTRPKIASSSWRLTWWYTLATIGTQVGAVFVETMANYSLAAGEVPFTMPVVAFDPIIFGTLAGPALWYMGMRGIDKWKAAG